MTQSSFIPPIPRHTTVTDGDWVLLSENKNIPSNPNIPAPEPNEEHKKKHKQGFFKNV